MRIVRWGLMAMMTGLLAGCQPKAPPPLPPPAEPKASPERAAQVRAEILSSDPLARVGQVQAVMAEKNLLAVGDIPVQDFKIGDPLLVVGANMNPLAQGTVERIEGGLLVVAYVRSSGATRNPAIGDLGVRLSDHPLPPGAHIPTDMSVGSPAPTSPVAPAVAAPADTTPPPATAPAAAPAGDTTAPRASAPVAPATAGDATPAPPARPDAAPAVPIVPPADAGGAAAPPTDPTAPKPPDLNK